MEIITVSTHRTRRSKNSGQFTETVLLTDTLKTELSAGNAKLRKGQWVLDGKTGQRGQFVGTKKVKGVNSLKVRAATPGLTFADYQKRLAA